MTAPPDGTVTRAAVAGDRQALEALLRELGPVVLRACRGILGPTEADDAAQESLIKLARALPTLREEGAAKGFATRIAIRTAMRIRRRRPPQPESLADEPNAPAREGAPHRAAVMAARRRFVRQLLDELPDEQAETLAMRFMLGHSLQEVADATDVPLNTVRSRVRLARQTMTKRFGDDPRLRELLEIHDA